MTIRQPSSITGKLYLLLIGSRTMNTDLTESSSRHCENELKAKKLQMSNAYKVLEFAKKILQAKLFCWVQLITRNLSNFSKRVVIFTNQTRERLVKTATNRDQRERLAQMTLIKFSQIIKQTVIMSQKHQLIRARTPYKSWEQ